ncbi:MAG: SHOCT domain-containing protein [Jatrophihabitantaceae bacterium]
MDLGRQPQIEDGVPAEGLALNSVASLRLDNMTLNSLGGWSRWLGAVPLQVQVRGRAPSYPTAMRLMSRAKYPVAGTILPLTVERRDPSIFRIEWDDVPEIDQMIASGHPVFTDPDSAEAAVRTAQAARAAAGIDTANRGAADQAEALMVPEVDRDAVYRAIAHAQSTQQAPDAVLQRQPIDGPSARILAVGYEDAGAASAAEIHGEILLSVAMPGLARFGVRWSGWIPQAKVRAQWWDVPVAVEMGRPPRVRILWDQVPGVEIVTPRLQEMNDRIEAQLATAAVPGMDAYSGLLAGIADPQQRARIEQQLAQALAPGPISSPAPLDPLDELKRLGELRASGSLTETQFAAEKARVLASM